MARSGSASIPPMESTAATRQETIQAFIERSKRHGTVGIRQAFLQPGRGRLAGAGPLAQFVRDSIALDLYLLLLLLGRGKQGGGHFVTVRSGTWIRALGLTGSGAAQTLSRALRRLEDRQLIRRTKAPHGVKVLMLREDGKGTSYSPPTPADRYFQLPFEYWSADYYLNLDMPAKIMLLIALGEANEFEMPIARVPGWYGISSETAQHGLEALVREGLALYDVRMIKDAEHPEGKRQAKYWRLQGPYHRELKQPAPVRTPAALRRVK